MTLFEDFSLHQSCSVVSIRHKKRQKLTILTFEKKETEFQNEKILY